MGHYIISHQLSSNEETHTHIYNSSERMHLSVAVASRGRTSFLGLVAPMLSSETREELTVVQLADNLSDASKAAYFKVDWLTSPSNLIP